MPGSSIPIIDPAGVAKRQILHAARERHVASLNGKVHVVGHETKKRGRNNRIGRFLPGATRRAGSDLPRRGTRTDRHCREG